MSDQRSVRPHALTQPHCWQLNPGNYRYHTLDCTNAPTTQQHIFEHAGHQKKKPTINNNPNTFIIDKASIHRFININTSRAFNGDMELRQRLSSVGISPSSEWLDGCLQYLREQNQTPHDDEILHQILNADLRDVVRCFEPSENDDDVSPDAQNRPSRLLRKSIEASTNDNKQGQPVLPQSFKCMVQVEELLDVSLNAEQRLTNGPASSSSPTATGDQSKRCLKMLLSDGYDNEGCRYSNADETSQASAPLHIVAMETETIPNLSVQSKPGLKVILSGPIVIRCGVLMLDEGNTTVLGGCIPHLIPFQRKAMELAAKVAGVGVDPTVRALVWNPETGMEEEQDEGFVESRNIQVRPRSATASAPSPRPQVGTVTTAATATRDTNVSRIQCSNEVSRHVSGGGFSDAPRTPFSTTSNSVATANPYERRATQQNQNTAETQSISESRNQPIKESTGNTAPLPHTPGPIANPYNNIRQGTLASSGSNESTTRCIPSNFQNTSMLLNPYKSTRKQPINPYAKNCPNPTQAKPKSSYTAASASEKEDAGMDGAESPQISETIDLTNSPDSTNQYSNKVERADFLSRKSQIEKSDQGKNQDASISIPPKPTNVHSPPLPTKLSSSAAILQNLSPTALSEPLSFSELRKLLEKIIMDPDEYSRYEQRTFIVPCKFPSKKTDFRGFNIEKNKNYKKKSKAGKVSGPPLSNILNYLSILSKCLSTYYDFFHFYSMDTPWFVK